MSSFSLLRRPRQGLYRASARDGSVSPSPDPHPRNSAGGRVHATADFTEADDDEDDDDDDDDVDEEGTFRLQTNLRRSATSHPDAGRASDLADERDGEDEDAEGVEDTAEEEEEEEEELQQQEEEEGRRRQRQQQQQRQQRGGDKDRGGDRDDGDDDDDDGENDGASSVRRPPLPVLPLFSAMHLDSLPVYGMTHSIRIIVSTRTETTLTWDQLRSPQVSQFLIKPMQQQIRAHHFSRATLYSLMANCLQFAKEGQRYAANAGISNTRAKVCELLALKMLKEYSTRELIDALAYDFYPLQGMPGGPAAPASSASGGSRAKNTLIMASRTSTLEVAIRASAKHFLAHPVVVQQLEAIWSGAITFYSSADTLHREEPSRHLDQNHYYHHHSHHYNKNQNQNQNHNLNGYPKADDRTPLLGSLPPKKGHYVPQGRRAVMLYDPRQASLLKLSRLRVPRYRSFLSTISLAVLIGLFLAVLSTRSVQITGLELVFWFWSAGFMLDELVGFNEQGFALYIMSFWNIFDLGILVMLIAYYCMRIYGVFLADPQRSNAMAYDVLAANAILLLPRIFSLLDHYQYFSQMLIAFRLMAADLVAVCVLILIVCSGFFVFFTSSQASGDAGDIAYRIFQILMGFTPAAWELWPSYNWLAKLLMALFLIICHFLVVTILISVLTNSFTAIASNANEEHQFLFAINTISMVKNDALFSYVAPSNIFAWLLMPLRYCMPLKQFVWLNRIIIKITHCPILFCIYLYERFWLAPSVYEPTDLVENRGRGRNRNISFADAVNRISMFSPSMRVREESVAGYQQDRALEELFLRQPDAATLRTQRRNERRKNQNAIRNWMDQNDAEGIPGASWSAMGNRAAAPEWQRRRSMGWDRRVTSRALSDKRSIASGHPDATSNADASYAMPARARSRTPPVVAEYKDQTDADGDDEFVTNDEDEDARSTTVGHSRRDANVSASDADDYFTTPVGGRSTKRTSSHGSAILSPTQPRAFRRDRDLHSQTLSSSTIHFNPVREESSATAPDHNTAAALTAQPKRSMVPSATVVAESSAQGGRRGNPSQIISNPKSRAPAPAPAPGPSAQAIAGTAGGSRNALAAVLEQRGREGPGRLPRPSQLTPLSPEDLSILSDNTNSLPFGRDLNAGLSGSFQTQMAMALMKNSGLRGAEAGDSADRDRMGRLVLAKMRTLEESFADVVKEMRELKNSSTVPTTRRNSSVEDFAAGTSPQELMGRPRNGKGIVTTPKRAMAPRRTGSRRSMRDSKAGFVISEESRRKGKYVSDSTEEDEDNESRSYTRKGSFKGISF
ncbi:Calcium channel YVC1 [Escovopsis weberi]|uniref:Calcium channel YVC1 n=1 Tax=Escovopsis weberi TaxID=150374 RepID=A0A0M9VSZ9_ESCWE|nr:Calcium channel YVC1 [Escovopsis weberi]